MTYLQSTNRPTRRTKVIDTIAQFEQVEKIANLEVVVEVGPVAEGAVRVAVR